MEGTEGTGSKRKERGVEEERGIICEEKELSRAGRKKVAERERLFILGTERRGEMRGETKREKRGGTKRGRKGERRGGLGERRGWGESSGGKRGIEKRGGTEVSYKHEGREDRPREDRGWEGLRGTGREGGRE